MGRRRLQELVPGPDGAELRGVAGFHLAVSPARRAVPPARVRRARRRDAMTDISGKVALVTGPARGIGEAVARALAARGARLALVGLEAERLRAAGARAGRGTRLVRRATSPTSARSSAPSPGTVAALGGIDVVVANAGIGCFGTVAVTPLEAQVRVIEVNLVGVLRTVVGDAAARDRAAWLLPPDLVGGGAGRHARASRPTPPRRAVSSTSVTRCASSCRPRASGVGVAHPCWIDTDLVRDARHDLGAFDEIVRRLPGPVPHRDLDRATARRPWWMRSSAGGGRCSCRGAWPWWRPCAPC